MLRILGRANSFNVRKVLWVCDELGVPYAREDWGRGFRPTTDDEFLKINPIGLVPAVIDDGVVLRESNAIVRYLAAKHGDGSLYPTDLVRRANVEQWMDWANYETSISLRGYSSAAMRAAKALVRNHMGLPMRTKRRYVQRRPSRTALAS